MNKKIIPLIIITFLMLSLLIGIFIYKKYTSQLATMSNKINAVTSFYPIYFLTSKIGGDLVDVTNLTPAGTEPHDYEPTAQDIVKIKRSEMLVLNGGGLEAWSDDLKNIVGANNAKIIVLGDDLVSQEVSEGGEIVKDPHIWLNPLLTVQMAEKITVGLIEIDLANRNYYQSNFNVLKNELVNLDNEYKRELSNCKKRKIITAHNAFSYLAKEYDIEQIPIAGLSPEEEPSIQQLAEIARVARENEIKYIFFESLANPKLSETIAQEVGAQTLVISPIEGVIAEELDQGKNYFTEMRENLKNLKKAMECS